MEESDKEGYVTVVNMNGIYHVNYMMWSRRHDAYDIFRSIHCVTMESAKRAAAMMAEEEGVEIR
jgi:hypothetical protein